MMRAGAGVGPRHLHWCVTAGRRSASERLDGAPAVDLPPVSGTVTMFAIIKTGGKQYRVAADDVITVEKLAGNPGDVIAFEDVLLLGADVVTVGSPRVAGATVAGELVEHTRGAKVIAFKKRRRKNSRRKRGHRQEFSIIRITEILTDGKKPAAKEPSAA